MMKSLKIGVSVLALMGASVCYAADLPTKSLVSNAPAIKIGVIDSQQIMKQAPQAIALNKQLQNQFQPRHDALVAAGKKLQDEIAQINKNGAVMSAGDREKLQNKIVADRASYQAMGQIYQQDLTTAENQAMQKFANEAQSAVTSVAKQGNYSMIIQRAVFAYIDPSLDVTSQVIKTMSKDS